MASSKGPLATILVAAYNQAAYLDAALDSALSQTLPREAYEILVVDDGSTDETSSRLRERGSAIRVVSQSNRGLVAACNAGIAQARGRYLARLDSDDLASPQWLERLLGFMQTPKEPVCVTCDRTDFFPDGRETRVQVPASNIYHLVACGTLFRAEILREIGGFRPFFWEEYDLYLRLKPLGRFAHCEEPLYRYRRHAGGMTNDPDRRRAGWLELLKAWGPDILKRYGRDPELSAILANAASKEIPSK